MATHLGMTLFIVQAGTSILPLRIHRDHKSATARSAHSQRWLIETVKIIAFMLTPSGVYITTASAEPINSSAQLEQLIEDYIAASKPLREFYKSGVQISAQGSMRETPDSQLVEYEFEYFANGKHVRCDTVNRKTGEAYVRVAAPDSSFLLRKEDRNSPYVVRSLDDPYEDVLAEILNEAAFASSPIAILDRDIVGWLRGDLPNEEVTLKAVREIKRNDLELVEVTLRRKLELTDKTIEPTVEITFRKNEAWALESLAMGSESEGLWYRCKVDYESTEDAEQLPFIRGVRFWKDTPEGEEYQVREYIITSLRPEPAKPIRDYFSLSAFGFSGALVNGGLTRYRIWMLVATVILVTVTLFLVVRKHSIDKSGYRPSKQ